MSASAAAAEASLLSSSLNASSSSKDDFSTLLLSMSSAATVFRIGTAILVAVVFTLSLTLNSAVLAALCQARIRHRAASRHSRHFVANLCLSNLLLTAGFTPFTAVHLFSRRPLSQPRSELGPQIAGFLVSLFVAAMTTSNTLITVNRHLAVRHPLLHHRACASKASMLLLSLLGWVVSVLLALVPFFAAIFIRELPYTFSESHSFFFLISCTSHIFYRVYAVVFVLCIYALPLLFLIVAYAGMYHSVKLISRRHSRPHCSDVSAAAIRHSLSTPDLAVHDSVISTRQFFSDKNNQRLAVDIKGTDRHWRKISAHACLSRPQPALSRCNSERERTITTSGYHPTENLVAASIDHSNNINTGGSLTSLIRKGSRICSRGLRRTVISLQQQRPNGREERAAAATCLIIVTTFLLLVSPYFVLFILQAFHIDRKVLHGQTKRSRDDSVWNTVSVLLLYLNCIATPAIYVLRDCVVRDEVRHLWLRCCSHRTSKHPLPSRDSANCSITAALAGSSLRLRPAGSALFTIGVIHERD